VNSPSRDTAGGRRYLDLQRLAGQWRRPTDELLQLYALEGFIERLTRPPLAESFVLKGGVLLAAFGARRPTRDVDLLGIGVNNEMEEIRALICEIASVDIDDGLDFATPSATAQLIRDEQVYSGVRVGMGVRLATARLVFHVDVNVGDPIWPNPRSIILPRLLGGHLDVLGYPLAMVHAEKLVTALERGTANIRWRDFVDVVVLGSTHCGSTVQLDFASRSDHRALWPRRNVNLWVFMQ
jgi:hypothetical protein